MYSTGENPLLLGGQNVSCNLQLTVVSQLLKVGSPSKTNHGSFRQISGTLVTRPNYQYFTNLDFPEKKAGDFPKPKRYHFGGLIVT